MGMITYSAGAPCPSTMWPLSLSLFLSLLHFGVPTKCGQQCHLCERSKLLLWSNDEYGIKYLVCVFDELK
ncbi:hypothetical protein BDL97_01G013800 [Sphagnum fallax]|nr:hypothetical protein BDL97_01G013800 [Sphagnum fallax]